MDRADGRSRFWSSGICACAAWQRSRPQRAKQRRKHGPYRSQKSQLFGNRCLAREPIRVHAGQRLEETNRDRKSTRLNSSHGYISYAVFCLKKKNYTPHSTVLEAGFGPFALFDAHTTLSPDTHVAGDQLFGPYILSVPR